MSLLHNEIQLLFINGVRIPLTINKELVDSFGFESNPESFRIGDLRGYIHQNWNGLLNHVELNTTESSEDVKVSPTTAEQIQLLHLGNRLNPNDYLNSLNLSYITLLTSLREQVEVRILYWDRNIFALMI